MSPNGLVASELNCQRFFRPFVEGFVFPVVERLAGSGVAGAAGAGSGRPGLIGPSVDRSILSVAVTRHPSLVKAVTLSSLVLGSFEVKTVVTFWAFVIAGLPSWISQRKATGLSAPDAATARTAVIPSTRLLMLNLISGALAHSVTTGVVGSHLSVLVPSNAGILTAAPSVPL